MIVNEITENIFRVVEESLGANDKYHAIVEQTGAVTYTFPVNKVIQCLSQTGEQSFECNFEIEPWATDKDLMSVRTFSPVIDLSMMDNNLDKAYSIRSAINIWLFYALKIDAKNKFSRYYCRS